MIFTTAQEIWDAIQWTDSKEQEDAQIYEIETKTAATKQGNLPVTEYSNTMKSLWVELDDYQNFKIKCNEHIVQFKSSLKWEGSSNANCLNAKMIKYESNFLERIFVVPIRGFLNYKSRRKDMCHVRSTLN